MALLLLLQHCLQGASILGNRPDVLGPSFRTSTDQATLKALLQEAGGLFDCQYACPVTEGFAWPCAGGWLQAEVPRVPFVNRIASVNDLQGQIYQSCNLGLIKTFWRDPSLRIGLSGPHCCLRLPLRRHQVPGELTGSRLDILTSTDFATCAKHHPWAMTHAAAEGIMEDLEGTESGRGAQRLTLKLARAPLQIGGGPEDSATNRLATRSSLRAWPDLPSPPASQRTWSPSSTGGWRRQSQQRRPAPRPCRRRRPLAG